MTHTPPPSPSAPTTPDRTRWTAQRASAFLRLLAQSGKVAPCARAVGMSARSAYRLRARAPQFAQMWAIAMEEAARLKAASKRPGTVHPLLAKGPPVAPQNPPANADQESHFTHQRVAHGPA